MKKRWKKALLTIVSTISLSSCFFSGKAESERLKKISDSVVDGCFSKKREDIKNVFAKNIVDEVENFDEQADCLIDYLKGDFDGYEYRNPSSMEGYYDSGRRKIYRWFGSFTVHTTLTNYYLRFYYCSADDFDKKNIGVIALMVQYAPNGDEELKKVDSDKWDEGAYKGITLL